jgi:hypothetical protein
MLVKLHKVAVSVAFVLLTGWLLAGSLHAPPASNVGHNQTTDESATKNEKRNPRETFWQRTFNDPTAFFTLWVAAFTSILSFSTIGLYVVTRIAANAALRQANVMMAVESPMPLVVGFNIVQYAQIPGETVVADPLPPGPIPLNCRFLFCIENKGRAPVRLVLEKGPIWIRGEDRHIVITDADVRAALIAYQNGGAFWGFGYFAYWNLLNERIEHRFLARWDQTHGFLLENRPGYSS